MSNNFDPVESPAGSSTGFDLQIHSNYSDGKYPPAELIKIAKVAGFSAVALTDHDTVNGLWEAAQEAKNTGLKFIPGIEITCRFLENEIHLLGYGIAPRNEKLNSRLKEFREDREKRAEKIVEKLREAGFKVTMEEVKKEAPGGVIAKPNIALAVINNPENKEKLGSIGSIHDFIEEYLIEGKPAYVDRQKVEAKEAIKLVHNAGGVAVWGHPTVSIKDDFKKIEEVLKIFISFGLDGLETFHADYNEDETEFLNTMAGKYDLLRTAGSDFHREPAEGQKTEGGNTLGYYQTFDFDTSDIVPKLEAAVLKRQLQQEKNIINPDESQ